MQQKYHFFDILLIIIGICSLVLFIIVADNLTVKCLKIVIRKDRQFSDIVVSRVLPDYKLKISEMIASHFDENNYYLAHTLTSPIPKIQMCFLIVYHIIFLIICNSDLICILILTGCIMKLTGCLEQEI